MKKKILQRIDYQQKIIKSFEKDIIKQMNTKYINYSSIKLWVEKIEKAEANIKELQLLFISI